MTMVDSGIKVADEEGRFSSGNRNRPDARTSYEIRGSVVNRLTVPRPANEDNPGILDK